MRQHRKISLLLLVVAIPLFSACGPPLPEAYVQNVQGKYVLRSMPCSAANITKAEVMKTDESVGYDYLPRIWSATSEGSSNGGREVALFQENAGYASSSPQEFSENTEIEIGYQMAGYSSPGLLIGKLSDIGEGMALTTDGIVSLEHVQNWWCG